MGVEFIYPEFEVRRSESRCIACRVCERQCANEVHYYDEERGVMMSDESKCVNCQRCVALCPTRALRIVKSDCLLRENANWQNDTIREIYKQANSGGVLLSSMGNPKPLPVYWDKAAHQRLAGDESLPSTRCASRWRPAYSSAGRPSAWSGTKTAG